MEQSLALAPITLTEVQSRFAAWRKTKQHRSRIGDLFMSLIHTCTFAKVNPFEYLTTLQKNSSALFANPSQWLPWNYKENLASPA